MGAMISSQLLPSKKRPAIIYGDKTPTILDSTLGDITDELNDIHRDKVAVDFPWQSIRRTFSELNKSSKMVASCLLAAGLCHGDRLGILAGNRYEFLDIFLAAARIGCPAVILQSNMSPAELKAAAIKTGCKLIFIAPRPGSHVLLQFMDVLSFQPQSDSPIQRIIFLHDMGDLEGRAGIQSYRNFLLGADYHPLLESAQQAVQPSDILCLMFTSGTTGNPKAAVLTHRNVVNNSHFFSRACGFIQSDIICSPLPLCHSFGLVSAFLSSFICGCLIVFPSEKFSADAVVDSLQHHDITVIYGVPTMFFAVLEKLQSRSQKPRSLVKAIGGGAPVPYALITQAFQEMGLQYFLNGYGMTETSPATFVSPLGPYSQSSLKTIGKVMPHTNAKIADRHGRTLQQGEKGELCISGLPLQRGYWEDEERTSEIMKRDTDGVIWLHTGDEAIIGADEYCTISGRIKDIIIRGGLNISPVEIEERLNYHPYIQEACVVGLPDKTHGQIVACFLKQYANTQRPSDEVIRAWVREVLGWHKAPETIFWIGDEGVGEDFPKTASGKHQKEKMREVGTYILAGKI